MFLKAKKFMTDGSYQQRKWKIYQDDYIIKTVVRQNKVYNLFFNTEFHKNGLAVPDLESSKCHR